MLSAASVTIIPDADATLMQIAPSNSMGAIFYVLAGTTQNGTPNRALMRFDVAGAVPLGSKITSAKLTVAAIRQSGEAPVGVAYGLHRMLCSWSEGTNLPSQGPGVGGPAQPGDSCWAVRFFPTNAWGAPGGAEDIDYSGQVTASLEIDSLGIYEIQGAFEMISDVQLWLDHPATNFGWMFKSENESLRFSARQFASRESEDPSIAPQLSIDYIAAPRIENAALTNGAIQFSFQAEPGSSYSVEGRVAFGGTNTWAAVTNLGFVSEVTNLTARISTNLYPQRFFRVRVD